jgi:hypothetical protein
MLSRNLTNSRNVTNHWPGTLDLENVTEFILKWNLQIKQHSKLFNQDTPYLTSENSSCRVFQM